MTPLLEWISVGRADEFIDGKGRHVRIGARRLAVFLSAGIWYAIKDVCPHAGVALHPGVVSAGTVACPAHGWIFDLATGEVKSGIPGRRVATYPVRVADGDVQIGI